jgi:hypothetical protein
VFNLSLAADDGWAAVQMAFRGAGTTALPQPTSIGLGSLTASQGTCSPASATTLVGSTATSTAEGLGVSLSASGLTFYADAACKYPVTGVHVGAGTSGQAFYVIGATAGSITLTATSSLGMAMETVVIN